MNRKENRSLPSELYVKGRSGNLVYSLSGNICFAILVSHVNVRNDLIP